MTRATRLAANAAAGAVLIFAALWLLSTQVETVRAFSRFAVDPWDAVATYAAIFLPFVAGPTWIRSLSHRAPLLPDETARRIRWGSGLASAIVLAAAATDLQAIATIGYPADAGLAATILSTLAAMAAAASLAAVVLVGRAWRTATTPAGSSEHDVGEEPDIVDDLLALGTDIAGRFGLRRPVERLAAVLERFLDGSAASPRRHRFLFGVLIAVAAAGAFDVWHAIREGPWASLVVPLVFGVLLGTGVLGIYLGTVGPLRILRPPRTNP
jgi:hypothetical protein